MDEKEFSKKIRTKSKAYSYLQEQIGLHRIPKGMEAYLHTPQIGRARPRFILKTDGLCEYDRSYLDNPALPKTKTNNTTADPAAHRDIFDYMPVEMFFSANCTSGANKEAMSALRQILDQQDNMGWIRGTIALNPDQSHEEQQIVVLSGTLEISISPYAIEELYLVVPIVSAETLSSSEHDNVFMASNNIQKAAK